MPLKAIIAGEPVIGPDLSPEEWADLKQRHKNGIPVTMACCGAPGHLRTSKRGTRHFYHAVDAGCHYAQESPEHLLIKEQIYRACRTAGWETTVEFPAPDRSWIADVYATRDGRKVVFEIQISTISPAELEDREGKYRKAGIESYWLLDNFLGRSKDFAVWYDSYLSGTDNRSPLMIPYIDDSLFRTGPENHIFIARGIRSAGLHAKKQILFTTNNPEIPVGIWVGEVLKGNYRNYLEETAAYCDDTCRRVTRAAPALIRARDFYRDIIRPGTCRKKVGHYDRVLKAKALARNGNVLQKKVAGLYAEIDWMEKEYHSIMADSYGLFTWKKIPGQDTPRPFFRFETEAKIRNLQECVEIFSRWEASFERAFTNLEQDFLAGVK